MTALIQTVDTADGAFTVLADARQRVLASGWTSDPAAIVARLAVAHRPERIAEGETDAVAAVLAYYRGDLSAIDAVAVKQTGTALHDNPRAVRAAASICARNTSALFVPCHRVLRTDGTLGGFAWGLDVKANLLARESAAR
jgi:methylated-DNA-[protein]-cysteine S-methyltransferase